MLRVTFWLLSGLLLLGAVCGEPLSNLQVVVLPGPSCEVGEYVAQTKLGGDWFTPDFLVGKVPPLCVAYPKGVQVPVRVFCRSEATPDCVLEGDSKNCELGAPGTCTEPCTTMLDHRGSEFSQQELATWNTANCGG